MSEGDGTTRTPLADLAPGPELAARLEEVDLAGSSDAELVEVICGDERQKRRYEGRQLVAVREFIRRRPEPGTGAGTGMAGLVVEEFAADELSCALRLCRSSAADRLDLALALDQRLPKVLDALLAGTIDGYRAKLIHLETEHLDSRDAAMVADLVLERAGCQTAQEMRNLTRRLALRICPKESEKAAKETARAARDVRMYDGDEAGNANLIGIMKCGDAAEVVALIYAEAQARKARPGETRSLGELRAECLVDAILGRTPEGDDPEVDESEVDEPSTDDDSDDVEGEDVEGEDVEGEDVEGRGRRRRGAGRRSGEQPPGRGRPRRRDHR